MEKILQTNNLEKVRQGKTLTILEYKKFKYQGEGDAGKLCYVSGRGGGML